MSFGEGNLRERVAELEAEWATDTEGVRIDVADTIHMLRSEWDGDHEWDDVVIELVYCKHGGDRWIVRGARGEAWACDCTVTGHDDGLYEDSDDWENLPTPWDELERENESMRAELVQARMHIRLSDTSELAKIEHIDKVESLALDLWSGLECDRCPEYGEDCWVEPDREPGHCRMMDRMAELRIEVGR